MNDPAQQTASAGASLNPLPLFMPVYFQHIPEDRFKIEEEFLVKESKGLRIFFGILLLLFGAYMFNESIIVAVIAGTLSLAAFYMASRNVVIMRISKDGFYYHNRLVTSWSKFVSAKFVDEAPTLTSSSLGLSDRFAVVIRYYKEDGKCYERKIPLTNTQNKSEEEVMAAIRFYSKQGLLYHSTILPYPGPAEDRTTPGIAGQLPRNVAK